MWDILPNFSIHSVLSALRANSPTQSSVRPSIDTPKQHSRRSWIRAPDTFHGETFIRAHILPTFAHETVLQRVAPERQDP